MIWVSIENLSRTGGVIATLRDGHLDKASDETEIVFVRRRHDIFDLGRSSRLQERQGVDENGGIRNELRGLLELGERDPGVDAALQDVLRFDVFGRGRQGRQIVERNFGIKNFPDQCK